MEFGMGLLMALEAELDLLRVWGELLEKEEELLLVLGGESDLLMVWGEESDLLMVWGEILEKEGELQMVVEEQIGELLRQLERGLSVLEGGLDL